MGSAVESCSLPGKIQAEIIFAQPVHVGHALDKVDLRNALAGLAQCELAELDRGIGRDPQRAAVLEFNLGAGVIPRAYLGALSDRQVDKGVFIAGAGVLIDLDGSMDVAKPDNPGLRFGQSGQRKKRAGGRHENYECILRVRTSGHGDPLEWLIN